MANEVGNLDNLKSFLKAASDYLKNLQTRKTTLKNARDGIAFGGSNCGDEVYTKRVKAWLDGAIAELDKAIQTAAEQIELIEKDIGKLTDT